THARAPGAGLTRFASRLPATSCSRSSPDDRLRALSLFGYSAHTTPQVIAPAFGRTGHDSMREALTILGFGPCHHMLEVNASEEQKRMWGALVQGAPPRWDQLFAGYGSAMDWPSAYYWRELIAFYPQAKVVLTYRT